MAQSSMIHMSKLYVQISVIDAHMCMCVCMHVNQMCKSQIE